MHTLRVAQSTIRELNLGTIVTRWLEPPTDVIEFPRVEVLSIRDVTWASHLRTPGLQHLRLTHLRDSPNQDLQPFASATRITLFGDIFYGEHAALLATMSNVVSLTVETPQPLLEPCPGAFLARHSVDRNFFRELAQIYPSIWPRLESIRIAPRGVPARDLDPPPAFYSSDLITFARSRNHTTVVGIEEDVPCRLKEVVVADTTAPKWMLAELQRLLAPL